MSKEKAWQLIAKKLAGEASVSELAELEELLRNDPDLHYALENVNDIWKLSPKISKEADQAFARHIERLKPTGVEWYDGETDEEQPPVHSRMKWYIITPAVILIIAGFFYFFQYNSIKNTKSELALKPVQPYEFSTQYGSKTKISLPDGSLVWLNSGSNLIYDKNFGNGTREVLLKGEAFFDVKHDAERPFIIHTSEADIKVLGTAFNVKSYPAERRTETSLIRGSIEVTEKGNPEQKWFLKPNQKLVLNQGPAKEQAEKRKEKARKEPHAILDSINHYERDEQIIVETAWVNNNLVFNDVPFKDMVENMERWYNIELKFLDPKIEQVRFTANFTTESIQQALDALSINREFTYTIEGNKVLIKK